MLLLKDTPENLWAISTQHPEAQAQLRQGVQTKYESVPAFRVLIAYIDQLHTFVQTVPPLAWELLEHAQEPLEIIYPQCKPRYASVHGQETEICVRWVKQPKLVSFLQKNGPHWATLASSENTPELPHRSVIACHDKNYPYRKVRTMRIQADGTFEFVR